MNFFALLNGVIEQIFPFYTYSQVCRKMRDELSAFIRGDQPEGMILSAVRAYSSAAPAALEEGLASEHERGVALDEKTFKHAASIATALTIASAAVTAVAQSLPGAEWKIVMVTFTIPAICYGTIGALLGFAAARTLWTFGAGMAFAVECNNASAAMKPLVLAKALACQEAVNLIRVARNEAAFMSIRNAFFCTILALSTALLGAMYSANKDGVIDRKVWRAAYHHTESIAAARLSHTPLQPRIG